MSISISVLIIVIILLSILVVLLMIKNSQLQNKEQTDKIEKNISFDFSNCNFNNIIYEDTPAYRISMVYECVTKGKGLFTAQDISKLTGINVRSVNGIITLLTKEGVCVRENIDNQKYIKCLTNERKCDII